MANPIRIEIPEGTVIKAATKVIAGRISKHWKDMRHLFYYSTYRITGGAAPTPAEMKLEMVRMFQDGAEYATIRSIPEIDVYIMAALEDQFMETGILMVSV